MSDYGKRIRQVSGDQEKTLRDTDRLLREIGSCTVELPPEKLPLEELPAEIDTLINRYREIRDSLESASAAIERMMHIDARQSAIKQTMKNLQSERDDLGRGLAGVYEQIGAVAFRLFRESPLVDAGFSSAFEGLARHQDEIRAIENKKKQLDRSGDSGEKRPILERVRATGKDLFLKKKLSVRENRLPRLLQSAGEQLAQSDFIDRVDDAELNRVAEPLRSVQRRWGEIDRELEDLTHESGRLVKEFNDLSDGHGLSRARNAQEKEIAREREQMDAVFLEIGRIIERERPRGFEEYLERLDKLRQEATTHESTLARLKAGRQLETTLSELKTCRNQQDKTANEIKELQNRQKKLKDEEKVLASRIEELEAERGDPTELFES
jgi:chromosome segregation ATPase